MIEPFPALAERGAPLGTRRSRSKASSAWLTWFPMSKHHPVDER